MNEAGVPSDRTWRKQTIVLAEFARRLAPEDYALRELIFEECEILGPAVLIVDGQTQIDGCRASGPTEGLIWHIDRGPRVGAVASWNCLWDRCRFSGVGFAG